MGEKKALAGVHVLDFSWVGVGPASCRYLADHGATVIRVESFDRVDALRTMPPFKDAIPGIDRAAYFTKLNCNKYGISLNLKKPQALNVAKRLVQWADVVVESYTPGVMKRLGLDYAHLRQIKPDIIMASSCLMGQTGPYAPYRGFGGQASALLGFFEITGYIDELPIGPYAAYSDFVAHRYLVIAILRALIYHRKTGKGQYIDQSQFEACLQFLAPAVLDYNVNGRVISRQGNRDPYAAPHGAYRCLGADRWCTLAVRTDKEWEAFCGVIRNPDMARDPRFYTLLLRTENKHKLDALVEKWTRQHTCEEVMTLMQEAGVPAGVVKTSEDIYEDPQLKHRQHLAVQDHREIGRHAYEQFGFRLSRTPGEIRCAAPCLGEHNQLVFKEILGLSDQEIADL